MTYAQAHSTPIVPFVWQLAAQLKMCGHNLASPDVVERFREKYETKTINDDDPYFAEGNDLPQSCVAETNHTRTKSHEEWQSFDLNEHKGKIVIPVNEVLGDDEMVSITRIFFDGTEDEFLAAIDAW